MEKYPTVEIDGEIYRNINGRWVDSSSLVPPREILKQIIRKFYYFDSLVKYSAKELREQLLYCKNEELTDEAIAIADELQSRYEVGVRGRADISGLRWLLPVRTSLYRMKGNPRKAIEIYLDAMSRWGDGVVSGPLYVSIAAAFCDIGDYETAIEFCKKTWALGERSEELKIVWKRAKSAY